MSVTTIDSELIPINFSELSTIISPNRTSETIVVQNGISYKSAISSLGGGIGASVISTTVKGLSFDGKNNTTPISHTISGEYIRTKPIHMWFKFRCPQLSQVRNSSLGRGIGGLSASATTCGNTSMSIYLNGALSKLGYLTARCVSSVGGDYSIEYADFCSNYQGQDVDVQLTRINAQAKLYVNGLLVASSTPEQNWAVADYTSTAYWNYGFCHSTYGAAFLGKIYEAAVGNMPLNDSEILSFSRTNVDGSMLRACSQYCIGNSDPTALTPGVDSTFNDYDSFNWHNYNKSDWTYIDAEGTSRTPESGTANSFYMGAVNMSGSYSGKLWLKTWPSTASSLTFCSMGTNVSKSGYLHFCQLKAQYISGGQSGQILQIGTSTDDGSNQNFEIIPTTSETSFSGFFVRHDSSALKVNFKDTSSSAGQEYLLDDVLVYQVGFYVLPDLRMGKGYQIFDMAASGRHAMIGSYNDNPSWVLDSQGPYFYKDTTSVSGSTWLGSSQRAVLPYDSRIDAWIMKPTLASTVSIGTTSGESNIASGVSLTANVANDVTLLVRTAPSGQFSITSNSSALIQHTIIYNTL